MNSFGRNITAFVVLLAVGIYFLKPTSSKLVPLLPVVEVPLKKTSRSEAAGSSKLKSQSKSQVPTPVSKGASPRGVAAAGSNAAVVEKENLVAQLKADQACYHSENCDFPKTDPRSYSVAVGRRIAQELVQFRLKFATEFPREAQALALEFASNQDGFVQEATLELLNKVPPSPEGLRAATQVVIETTDPGVVDQALGELKRYVGTGDEAEVHQALGKVLSHGGFLAAQKASEGILPFLNPRSVGYYQSLLRTLAPGSEVARNLRISLQEYQRMSTGG